MGFAIRTIGPARTCRDHAGQYDLRHEAMLPAGQARTRALCECAAARPRPLRRPTRGRPLPAHSTHPRAEVPHNHGARTAIRSRLDDRRQGRRRCQLVGDRRRCLAITIRSADSSPVTRMMASNASPASTRRFGRRPCIPVQAGRHLAGHAPDVAAAARHRLLGLVVVPRRQHGRRRPGHARERGGAAGRAGGEIGARSGRTCIPGINRTASG